MQCVRAQSFPDIQFSYLTEKEGMSSSQVNYITQDAEGFLWFGTEDGLNRFDGYRIKRFFHNPADENSLVDNKISGLTPDGAGHLWIATVEGVSCYDKNTGQFHNYRHNPADTGSLDADAYLGIYSDKNNTVWVTTPTSLYRFDSSFNFKRVPTGFKDFNVDGGPVHSYVGLSADKQGRLWGRSLTYLFQIDPGNHQIIKKYGPFRGNILQVFQDSNQQLWLATFGDGLEKFDPVTGEFSTVKLSSPSQVVFSMTEWKDKHHNRWLVLATDLGIILVDPVTLHNKDYTFRAGYQQRSISGNAIQYVFVDRQNILWIGTEAGICYAEPSMQSIELSGIRLPSDTLEESIPDNIYSASENSQGLWAVRWRITGIYKFDRSGALLGKILTVRSGNKELTLADTLRPYYIKCQGDSTIWFTTNRHIVHFDLRSHQVQLYSPPDGYFFTGLRSIVEYDEHTWWIRTRNNGPNGIYIFNPITRQFIKHFTYSDQLAGSVPRNVVDLFLSRRKEIYLTADDQGLVKYDREKGIFTSVFRFGGKDISHHSNYFNCIAEDKEGKFWIGTNTGLFILDPATNKVVTDYTSSEFIGSLAVTGVTFDDQQNAWLATSRGIFCIVHSSGQIRQLGNSEGLPNNFTDGILMLNQDHMIYSSIRGFLVRIRPAEFLSSYSRRVDVHFSEATVTDIPYFFQVTASGEKRMIIEPGQNRFTLDFSVMNYDLNANNRYYYRLDGIMKTWQQNENGHLAFYNLSPGEYRLHIKGDNKYHDLITNEDAVTIIVKPHWWQTTWFKLLCVGVVALLIAWILQRRILVIRREASFKQKIAETEMMALRSQMNPHFIFNSLNSIENFMMKNEKRLASSYLNKFARLIRMILDSSRNELVPISKDVEALKLYVDLEQLRFNNKFSFSLELDPLLKQGDYRVPSLLIQPYVENAIVHGLAHSENEDLKLTVAAILNGDCINYIIEDNGVGRQLASVYNKQNKPHHKSVGLKITEERIHVFNQQQGANGHVRITDLYDEHQNPTGTRVEITLKAV